MCFKSFFVLLIENMIDKEAFNLLDLRKKKDIFEEYSVKINILVSWTNNRVYLYLNPKVNLSESWTNNGLHLFLMQKRYLWERQFSSLAYQKLPCFFSRTYVHLPSSLWPRWLFADILVLTGLQMPH